MFTDPYWWRDAGERALATFAQALLAALSVDFAFFDGNAWRAALATGLMAALLSLLKSMVAVGVGDPTSAAMLPAPRSEEMVAFAEELPEGVDVPLVDDDEVPVSGDD